MYFTPVLPSYLSYADEAGIDIMPMTGPSRTVFPASTTVLFWSMQIGWRLADNTSAGGGHMGIQAYSAASATLYGAINFGVYDDYHHRWYYAVQIDATGGTWTASYGGFTTSALAWNASAATIQTALRALTPLVSSAVTVTGTGTSVDPYWIKFPTTFSTTTNALTFNGTNLTGLTHSVIDWNAYPTFRGSIPTASCFYDLSNGPTFGFNWAYGKQYRLRLFKSPKQDWLAAQLDSGAKQFSPYVGTDQQADEVAFRCTVQNVTDNAPPVTYRDILIRNPATSQPLQGPSWWTEFIPATAYNETVKCRFFHPVWNGPRTITTVSASYDTANAPVTTDVHLETVSGTVYTTAETGVTRTNANNTLLTLPSGAWNASPANVTPSNVDVSARVTTPRPWF